MSNARTNAPKITSLAGSALALVAAVIGIGLVGFGSGTAEAASEKARSEKPSVEKAQPAHASLERVRGPKVQTARGGHQCTIDLDLKVFLEGALDANELVMGTELNDQGLLPAVDPAGTGVVLSPDVRNKAGGDRPVDWVHIEIRDAVDPTFLVTSASGVVQADGDIVPSDFASGGIQVQVPASGSYYAIVYHKSHLPVASPILTVVNGALTYDWTTSATGPFGGFHQLEPHNDGRFAMITGNADQSTPSNTYGVDSSDLTAWTMDSGDIGVYVASDFDMNGDVNIHDENSWQANNGLFVGMPF